MRISRLILIFLGCLFFYVPLDNSQAQKNSDSAYQNAKEWAENKERLEVLSKEVREIMNIIFNIGYQPGVKEEEYIFTALNVYDDIIDVLLKNFDAAILTGKNLRDVEESLERGRIYREKKSDSEVYIKIVNFSRSVTDDFEDIIKTCYQNKVPKIVIDLRGNKGGVVDDAVKMLDLFFPRGVLFFKTEGRYASHYDGVEYFAKRDLFYDFDRIEILVDQDTASMAEAFAAVMRYYNQAIIKGEKTAGDNRLKTALILRRGKKEGQESWANILLPVAKFVLPNGLSWDGGIIPDEFCNWR